MLFPFPCIKIFGFIKIFGLTKIFGLEPLEMSTGFVDEDPVVLNPLNSSVVDSVRLQVNSEYRRLIGLREESTERLQKLKRKVCWSSFTYSALH